MAVYVRLYIAILWVVDLWSVNVAFVVILTWFYLVCYSFIVFIEVVSMQLKKAT